MDHRYFNPRSHERSDPVKSSSENCCQISIHAPTRGATEMRDNLDGQERISIHAPTRGATCTSTILFMDPSISIHAPTRGATPAAFASCSSTRFQSTLPREERRRTPGRRHKDIPISIHAPTRGATPPGHMPHQQRQNFNPRSHERSDKALLGTKQQRIHFNPRSHERSDGLQSAACSAGRISIHAPTRGATATAKR